MNGRMNEGQATDGGVDSPPSSLTTSLLDRFRAGDESALGVLYDSVGARAYGLALRVVRDGPTAEDVVQSAFATLWQQADRLDESRVSIEGLLLTVLHRRAVDAARARARRLGLALPLDLEPVEEATPADETVVGDALVESALIDSALIDSTGAEERAREVRSALEVLTETQREVVILAYFDGLSQQDIASLLEVPLGTVKSRLRLAMQRLRYELAPPGGGSSSPRPGAQEHLAEEEGSDRG